MLRIIPRPHFLAFKLLYPFIRLRCKRINGMKVLRGQSWGAGKKRDAFPKAAVVFPADPGFNWHAFLQAWSSRIVRFVFTSLHSRFHALLY